MFLKFPSVHLQSKHIEIFRFYGTLKMREKIIHKSTELFLNLGFKSVTMDDIASEMGISKKNYLRSFSK